MSAFYPYIGDLSSIPNIVKQFRKTFPKQISADVIRTYGFAKKHESRLISILKFINVIDENGNKRDEADKIFKNHADEEFQDQFSGLIKDAYSGLFEYYGEDDPWMLNLDQLRAFFRVQDNTSVDVQKLQAKVFIKFAELCGKREPSKGRAPTSKKTTKTSRTPIKNQPVQNKAKASPTDTNLDHKKKSIVNDLGLSVKVEINLPADASKETYDAIFKSIRENLVDA